MDMRTILRGLIVITTAAVVFVACKQGDTDGGGNDTTPGVQYVSDGAAGARLTLELEDDLVVAGTANFLVLATDPDGAPIPFLKITCDTERGIAILEPSTGFEHTSTRGGMSGVLGGDAPGSYLIECRGPNGTNLLVRKTLRVAGDIPPGFTGFAGAAGGGLGGGLVDDGDDDDVDGEQVNFNDIQFTDVIPVTRQVAVIDLTQIGDCDGDVMTADAEPFGEDAYSLSISNNRDSSIEIDSVEFAIGGVVTSFNQSTQVIIPAGASTSALGGPYTFISGGKRFSGTNTAVTAGTFNVTFTVTGSNLDQTEPFTITRSAVMTANNYDNCP